MSESEVVVRSGGVGFGGALFLVFLVLKLTEEIDWSWFWVTSPLWIPLALLATGLAMMMPFMLLSMARGRR
jgi:hypothetical protein